jgi:3-oxoacyl-[acyl-carrier protein] reductase
VSKAGNVCIVTGSSSGIGAATAMRFAKAGFDIVVNFSRDEAPAQAVADKCRALGAKVLVEKADVSEDADCRRLADAVGREWGAARVVVNNAGRTKFVDLRDLDGINAQDFHDAYAVNTIGPFQMARAFAPLLRKTPGAAIINVSSIAARMGMGSSIGYMGSKGALDAITIALARALGPEIRVNGVAPGMIDGEWLRKGLGDEGYVAAKSTYSAAAALESIIDPADVAETIFFLATGAPKTTGEVLLVDAGLKIGHV